VELERAVALQSGLICCEDQPPYGDLHNESPSPQAKRAAAEHHPSWKDWDTPKRRRLWKHALQQDDSHVRVQTLPKERASLGLPSFEKERGDLEIFLEVSKQSPWE
jgi:hypothetical protein